MNRQASILLNNISSSSGGNSLALLGAITQRSYFQQLIHTSLARSILTAESLRSLGRQLADIAHHAYFLRQVEAVDQASRIMLALPISSELKGIARYYQAICAIRKSDIGSARRLLEQALREAPQQYKARVLLSIGATYYECGEIDAALPFYIAARKAAVDCDLLTLAESQQMMAVVRSLHGDHKQALDDLEQMFPLVRAIGKRNPVSYYDYLNSLAVEFGEVGRIDEAEAACAITLASPFSRAYPNWLETRDEVKAKRACSTPSVVAVRPAPDPQAQPSNEAKRIRLVATGQPAFAKALFQRSIPLQVVATAIVLVGIMKSILDRVRYFIYPRSPPSHFQN